MSAERFMQIAREAAQARDEARRELIRTQAKLREVESELSALRKALAEMREEDEAVDWWNLGL